MMTIPPLQAVSRRESFLALLSGALWFGEAAAQEPVVTSTLRPVPAPLPGTPMLTIGLQDVDSPVSDISVAVVTEAFRRAQVGLTFRRASLTRQIELANSGEIDGDLHRISTVVDKYRNLMLVPTSINRIDVAVYGIDPALVSMSREEVGKLSVVLQRGIFVANKYNPSPNSSEAHTVAGALEMVLNRRVEVGILSYTGVEVRTVRPRASDMVRWPHLWASEPMYLVLNRRNAAVVPRIDAALQQMQKEGAIEAFYRDTLARHGIKTLSPEPPAAAVNRGRS